MSDRSVLSDAELVALVAETLWANYGYLRDYGPWHEARHGLSGKPAAAAVRCEEAAAAVVQALDSHLVREPPEEGVQVPDLYSPIHLWADGSGLSSGGPAGAGYVLHYHGPQERYEGAGVPLGHGTNNVAELSAILHGLTAIPEDVRARPVVIHSDSKYALGVVEGTMRARANAELVAQVQHVVRFFRKVSYVHVPGHTGVLFNEVADKLAGRAGRSQAWIPLTDVWTPPSSPSPPTPPPPR